MMIVQNPKSLIGPAGKAIAWATLVWMSAAPCFDVVAKSGDGILGEQARRAIKQWHLHWRHWRPKWKAAICYATSQGWLFRFQDKTRIRDTVFVSMQSLTIYKRMRFTEQENCRVIHAVAETEPVTAQHLINYLHIDQTHLWHLLATRRMYCDLTRPLDDHTSFRTPSNIGETIHE